MTSLFIHAALGTLSIGICFALNFYLYRRHWKGSQISLLEGLYYALAVGSVCTGWYFNVKYVQSYPADASWPHFIKMLFTNPAAGSGFQDLVITNVLLFPMWTISDGPRRGLKGTWIYFTMSLFTSFGFAMGLYLAVQERQVRWQRSKSTEPDGGACRSALQVVG